MPNKSPSQSKSFQCTENGCDKTLTSKQGIKNHIAKHSSGEDVRTNPNLESGDNGGVQDSQGGQRDLEKGNELIAETEEGKDEWLFAELDNIGQVYDVPEKEDEAKTLKAQIERIKTVVKKKA